MALEFIASIAGLVSLVGLFVQSTSSLYVFCSAYPKVAAEISHVIEDIQSLEHFLREVESFVRTNAARISYGSTVLLELEKKFIEITSHLEEWMAIMKKLQNEKGKNTSNIIKKLKSAADKGKFLDMRIKVSSLRNQLSGLFEILAVQLERQTFRCVETIDSKVDALTVQQENSKTQLDIISETVKELRSIRFDEQMPVARMLDSTKTIQQQLNDIQLSHDCSQSLSQQQADKLDSIMVMMQYTLLNSQNPRSSIHRQARARQSTHLQKTSKKTSRLAKSTFESRSKRSVCSTPPSPKESAHLLNLVDTAVTVKFRRNGWHFEMVAIPDESYEIANIKTKIRMVKVLQDLRLLIWLFRQERCQVFRKYRYAGLQCSNLLLEYFIASAWVDWSYYNLRPTLLIADEPFDLGLKIESYQSPLLIMKIEIKWGHAKTISSMRWILRYFAYLAFMDGKTLA